MAGDSRQLDLLVRSVEHYAIFMVDVEGRVASWSPGAERIKGYTAAEILGKPIEVFYPDDNRADKPRTLLGIAKKFGSVEDEGWRLRKDGSRFWAHVSITALRDENGKLLGFAKITADQTQRRATEEQLRQSAALFETVIDSMSNGLVVVSQGKYLIVNRRAREIMGHVSEEKGPDQWRSQHDLFRPDQKTLFKAEDLPVMRALRGESTEEVELWLQHKHSSTGKWVRAAGRPLFDSHGAVSGAVVVFRDVTLQKTMEAELELTRAQSVSNARLSALGMMAGSIAHEINNPLAIIHGAASNIIESCEDATALAEPVLKNSERIIRTAERIARIVKSLRQIAREGTSDPFYAKPLHEIIDVTLELCRERFRHHSVELHVPTIDPGLSIRCREVQVEQVLLNLLQNGFEAVQENTGEKWVRLEAETIGKFVAISLIDNGPGIPEDARSHVFEPFFTTKPVGKGTGLGLSISKTIVEEHGGTIEIGEEAGNTRVTLTLPVAESHL